MLVRKQPFRIVICLPDVWEFFYSVHSHVHTRFLAKIDPAAPAMG